MKTQLQPEFFGALQSLRGLAALVVVLFHIPAWYRPFFEPIPIRNGYLMVEFFFVLSGFVLMHAYGREISSRKDLLRFIGLRLGRLYPVHLLFLLLFLGVEIARYVFAAGFGVIGPNNKVPFQENNLGAFGEHLLMVQALGFTSHATTFNAPSWSISTEFYTYLLFGIGILLLTAKGFARLSIAIVLLSMGALVILSGRVGDFWAILECLAGFFLGCLTYMFYRSIKERFQTLDWPMLVLVGIVLFLCIKEPNSVWDALMFPFSALLILCILTTPASLANIVLKTRPLEWLGETSYSLYMSHALVLWIANQVCRVALKMPEALVDGMLTPRLPLGLAVVAYPMAILATVAAAWLTHRFVEYPCRQWTRKYFQNAPSPMFARQAAEATLPTKAIDRYDSDGNNRSSGLHK